jgi:hypothetical protein
MLSQNRQDNRYAPGVDVRSSVPENSYVGQRNFHGRPPPGWRRGAVVVGLVGADGRHQRHACCSINLPST